MSWDRKGDHGKLFYYRTRRAGRRVVKTYFGRGSQAIAAARQDERVRLKRQADHQYWDQVIARLEAGRRENNDLLEITKLLTRSVLVAHGHYLHKGSEWRRRGKMHHG